MPLDSVQSLSRSITEELENMRCGGCRSFTIFFSLVYYTSRLRCVVGPGLCGVASGSWLRSSLAGKPHPGNALTRPLAHLVCFRFRASFQISCPLRVNAVRGLFGSFPLTSLFTPLHMFLNGCAPPDGQGPASHSLMQHFLA